MALTRKRLLLAKIETTYGTDPHARSYRCGAGFGP